MPTLINETIPASHLALLDDALKHVGENEASVSRFERFGFSGAYLYKLTPPGAFSFVVKIDLSDRIKRECDAAYSVRNQFVDLHVEDAIGQKSNQKALMYRLITGPDGDVVELKQKYETALNAMSARVGDPEVLLKHVVSAIQSTYKQFRIAHQFTNSATEAKFVDQYANYVKRRDGTTDRLTELFASHAAPLSAYEMKVNNPRIMIERILNEPLRPLWVVATHGDLHPSNVVFSLSDDARLVDFAKAGRNQHLLKDFVTMESSLRFMMFPRHIHPALVGPIDAALNQDWKCKDAETIIEGALSLEGAWALKVMVACVREVRTACDNVLKLKLTEEEKKEEYFRCLALLLLGQQQFDTFPLIRVAVNLHMLGELYA